MLVALSCIDDVVQFIVTVVSLGLFEFEKWHVWTYNDTKIQKELLREPIQNIEPYLL